MWNTDDNLRVTDLRIVERGMSLGSLTWLTNSAGACDDGWMDGGPLSNPMGLFLWLSTAYGFASRGVVYDVLRKFGKIDGQEWVDDLLYRFDQELDPD